MSPVKEAAVGNPMAMRTNNDRMSRSEETYFERRKGLLEQASREAIAEQYPLYATRQIMTWFLARYEIFKLALDVPGDIIECGVGWGGGLMWWAQLSAIFAPTHHRASIVGFDSFGTYEQFAVITPEDGDGWQDYAFHHDLAHLQEAIACYDLNRALNHIPRVKLVKGNACETMPQYLEENPHTIVKILSLDYDVFLPSKVALETFVSRMPKGAIIVFDQLGASQWRGEGLAVLQTLGFHNLELKCFPWEPAISYARLT